MTSLLDNLDCSSDSDDIHRLFPKCRRPANTTTTTTNNTTVTSTNNTRDVNLNTLHDDNDNRVMMLNMMQGDVLSNNTSSPTSTPLNSTPATELLMEVPPPLLPNVNGLGSCGERRGVDADDEEEDEEDELEDPDDTPEGSQGEGSPPLHHDEVPNGTSSSSSSYRKYNKHLRDSRIEIAGGREVFSQSKSKAARKRYSDDNSSIIINNTSTSNNTSSAVASAAAIGTLASLVAPRRSSSNNTEDKVGIWEVRGGNSSTRGGGESMKKVSRGNNIQISSNAPALQQHSHQQLPPTAVVAAANNSSPVIPAVTEMVTETVFSTEVRSIRRVSDARFRIQSNNSSPVVYEAPSTGVTEVVVFDDIGECLAEQHLRGGQNRHLTTHNSGEEDSTASSSTGRDSPPIFHRPPADFFKVRK